MPAGVMFGAFRFKLKRKRTVLLRLRTMFVVFMLIPLVISGKEKVVIQNNLGKVVSVELIDVNDSTKKQELFLRNGKSFSVYFDNTVEQFKIGFLVLSGDDRDKYSMVYLHIAKDSLSQLNKGKDGHYGLTLVKRDIAFFEKNDFGKNDFEKIVFEASVIIDSNVSYPYGAIDSSSYFVFFLHEIN